MAGTSHPSPGPSLAATRAVTNPGPSVEDVRGYSGGEWLADRDGTALSEPISAATASILAALARHRTRTAGDGYPA